MRGDALFSSTLRKLFVYLFDVLCDYWKFFLMYDTKSNSRTLFVKVDAYN